MSFSFANPEIVQQQLQTLVECPPGTWNYAIIWKLNPLGVLEWHVGYYKEEQDEGNWETSSSSGDNKIRVLNSLALETNPTVRMAGSLVLRATGMTDTERLILDSMSQTFKEGTGLLIRALNSSRPVWVTAVHLSKSLCPRVRQAKSSGIHTLVFVPSDDCVVELGSTDLIRSYEFDLLGNVWILLDSMGSKQIDYHKDMGFQPVQPESESESSNSAGNDAVEQSNFLFPVEETSLDLDLRLGLQKAWIHQSSASFPVEKTRSNVDLRPVGPQDESISSSSVRNYSIIKQKSLFQTKSDYMGDDDSDNKDVSAFIRIMRRGVR